MEAARVAALRGHRVTLCEKGQKLGGLMILGKILNEKLEPLVTYMVREIKKLPIEVRLRTEVTIALLEKMKPDAVILAVGGTHIFPEVPGTDRNNVMSSCDLVDLFISGIPIKKGVLWRMGSPFVRCLIKPSIIRKFLRLNFPIKKRVAVIGGQFAGCELAQALIGKGKEITVIEESEDLGSDIGASTRWGILTILKQAGVRMMRSATVLEINDKGVKVRCGGATEFIEADTVILAQGVKPDAELVHEMQGKIPVLYSIGDCAGIGRIREAIASGFETGSMV